MRTISKIITGIAMSILLATQVVKANPYKADTIILKFKNNVFVVVVADNESDLESVLNYDLNQIFKDLKYKTDLGSDQTYTLLIEEDFGDRFLQDTTVLVRVESTEMDDDDDDYDYEAREKERERSRRKRTRNYYNIDIGMNNYLSDGKFPDDNNELYTVRPWGSWYLGLVALFKTNVAGPLYIEWGGGIDWYAFKYENHRTRVDKTDLGLTFFEDNRVNISPVKSKMSIAYLNFRFIPVFDFSRSRRHGNYRLWNHVGEGFRFGFGPYAAYRIDSWTKAVYKEEGDKEKDKEKSNYYINNFRYGARFQIGWKGVDLFVNYDIQELFTDNKDTPSLNAFSFGFTL